MVTLASDQRPITRAEADLLFDVVMRAHESAKCAFVESGTNVPKDLKCAVDVVVDIRDRFGR